MAECRERKREATQVSSPPFSCPQRGTVPGSVEPRRLKAGRAISVFRFIKPAVRENVAGNRPLRELK